jgi:hypothetical protein
MKRLLLLSLLVACAVPAQALAATPCRNKIFNDWYADGRIASTYPHACYVDALHHIPPDADEYSSLRADITDAMHAGVRHAQGKAVPKQVGAGFAPNTVLVTSRTKPSTRSAPHDPAPSSVPQGPKSSTQSANAEPNGVAGTNGSATAAAGTGSAGPPLPVLALGGLALALVAAGAIGAGLKRSRSRRR